MKKISLFLVTILTVGVLAACASKDDNAAKEGNKEQNKQEEKAPEAEKVDPKETVAIVNGKEIKGEEYNMMLEQTQMMMMQFGQAGGDADKMKDQTLNALIDQEVLSQEVADKGYKASEDEVNKYLEEIKAGYESEEKFKEALEGTPLTMETLKAQLAEELALEKYMEKELGESKVTDDQVKDYYNQAKEQSEAQQKQAPEGEEKAKEGEEAPESKFPELAEVEDQIRGQLEKEEKQKQLQTIVEDLKKNSDIEKKI